VDEEAKWPVGKASLMPDSDTVLVPGGRDVRATLDAPAAEACVVACPPHPQMGGKRSDARLTAVADALAPDAATLRFDYGPWDEGEGELADARNALAWARDHYGRVALFGYSFGGCIALLAAARESGGERSTLPDASGSDHAERHASNEAGRPPAAVAALAPASRLSADLDATAALDAVSCPGYVLYGERDTTAEWEPVVERARALGWSVESMAADHHFVGQAGKVGERCGAFLRDALAADDGGY
jgi:alpha/beta superfamily hydrolase